jgi:hypothetical protein
MTVIIDRSMRLYLMISDRDGVTKILERGSAGGEYVSTDPKTGNQTVKRLIRRKSGEDEAIGVRKIYSEDAEKLFFVAENVSGGDLLKCWIRDHAWRVTAEAKEVIDRVIYIEDTVEWLKTRASERQAQKQKWLDLAKRRRAANF